MVKMIATITINTVQPILFTPFYFYHLSEDGTTFWRVKDKAAPHNAVTSTEKLLNSAKSKKYSKRKL